MTSTTTKRSLFEWRCAFDQTETVLLQHTFTKQYAVTIDSDTPLFRTGQTLADAAVILVYMRLMLRLINWPNASAVREKTKDSNTA